MSFDSTGLTPKDAATILEELNREVLINLRSITGDPEAVIDTSVESPIGKLNEVFSNRLAEIWTSGKQVEDAMRVDKATGSSLERLAFLVGFVRIPASFTRGDLRFFGDSGTLIPVQQTYTNIHGDEFTNPTEFEIQLTKCFSLNVESGVVRDSTNYAITIDNVLTTIVSNATATNLNILTDLKDAIVANTEIDVTVSVITDEASPEDSDWRLYIVNDEDATPFSIILSPLLISSLVEVEQVVVARESGLVFGSADTINNITTGINGLESINNPKDFILGQIIEDDDDLRKRVQEDYNVVGSGTVGTITAIFSKNINVRSVLVQENDSYTTDVNGIEPKAYEVILSHTGTAQDMGQIVWDTKPAGIKTNGDIPINIVDASGDTQEVRFSEAESLYVYFKIDGTQLPPSEGETLPTDYVKLIQESCVESGSSYEINQDVFGKRFYGPIYDNVSGIDELTVLVYLSPTLIPIGTINPIDWKPTWEVDRKQIADFGIDNRFEINIT